MAEAPCRRRAAPIASLSCLVFGEPLGVRYGLYGPLIVLEPGERIGLKGISLEKEREPVALNGSTPPAPIVMRAGVPNRLRLINITANGEGLPAFITDRFEPTTWKPLAKYGATLPPGDTASRPARQTVSVGETYDFESSRGHNGCGWKCAAEAEGG